MLPLEVHLGLPSLAVTVGRSFRPAGVGVLMPLFNPVEGDATRFPWKDEALDLEVGVFRGMLLDPKDPGGMLK